MQLEIVSRLYLDVEAFIGFDEETCAGMLRPSLSFFAKVQGGSGITCSQTPLLESSQQGTFVRCERLYVPGLISPHLYLNI